MKLPADSIIAREKLTRYLLVKQPRGDKSAFLALAGYDAANADQLEKSLRAEILPQDATLSESNEFGQLFEIRAQLTGPNGRRLAVRTIWMTEHLSRQTKFITLVPDRPAKTQ